LVEKLWNFGVKGSVEKENFSGDSDFNSAAITDVVLVADTDVADFALAAGGEKGVICAQCGAGPSTYPPAPTLAERTLQRAIEVQHDIAVMECLILAMDTAPEKTPPKEKFYEPAIVWRCKFQPVHPPFRKVQTVTSSQDPLPHEIIWPTVCDRLTRPHW
jgi:hypothetical protein